MKKVSVIIPAYNCEKTLIQCLGNIVNQTLKDIEVILVNDASTDSTWDIILECEKQFPEIIMAINLEINRGAGGARNVGLMYATGKYIGFVDSDDIIATDMYEKLYDEAVMGNYDIVDCGYYNEEKDTEVPPCCLQTVIFIPPSPTENTIPTNWSSWPNRSVTAP